ncbi:MAG: DUF1318 domain-containing protein [Candidatus Omnitrophica bacterium]|nr:DUF1318 domain-containing protein [Candidatus Omnitrophota bacterium]
MKKVFFILSTVALISCAKVNLQTSQPLKVDINMRVDVYQHVAKDVESIQDQIYGSTPKQINAILLMNEAYAQEYSADVTAAIERRKTRLGTIDKYFAKGYIGENKDAYLQYVAKGLLTDLKNTVESIIAEENADRSAIYKAIAQKNGVDVSETAKVFFDDDYKRAPSGYWFEVYEGGQYIWKQK